ncbi:MAG: bifunctional serine/threonine-protein kinase/formylglycine-generating enzyme family protein [Planctomycetota bacterium]
MADKVPDEAFARTVQQAGMVSFERIEEARRLQEEAQRNQQTTSLADALVRIGAITQEQRQNLEKKIQAEQDGGAKQLGPYKLLKKLGEGGMGAVFLADDTSVGRKVAVKVLPKKYSEEREFLTRFRREAQATGKLSHANIVTAYNVGEDAGTHYYAMEYCDGDTLDRILKREEYLPWDKAIAVVIQVARGLKHAHEHNIIHRDIKPANIFICKPLVPGGKGDGSEEDMFSEGFVAKILDLGLSKNIGSTEQSYLTQTGAALGTPHYISPEQARGDKAIDGRTDIYSLGATLYHLVTGQTPFSGTTAGVVIAKHLSEQLPNPQDIRDDLPDGVVQIIQKMMAKDAGDRYANCAELLVDLELASQGKQPSSVDLDPALTTIATRQRGAQSKGAGRPRAARPGAAVVRKKGEPAEPLAATLLRKGAASPRVPHSAGLQKPRFGRKQYIAAGVAGLGLLVLIAALAMSGKSESPISKSETGASNETPKSDTGKASVEPVLAKAEALPKEMSLDLGGGVKMEMVLVPAGEFMMGSDDGEACEKPVHKVKISKPFYMGKFPVTVAQFRAFAKAMKFQTEAEKSGEGKTVRDGKWQVVRGVNWQDPGFKQEENHPVVVVSWNDTQGFCEWATKLAGRTFRLPTEAEWEYAARGPKGLKYPWGDWWNGKLANHADLSLYNTGYTGGGNSGDNDGYAYTSPVGIYQNASWCGAFDMSGNVWQWCADFGNDKYYGESPVVDPQGPANGSERVRRGGSWYDPPCVCRSAQRKWDYPGELTALRGFRVLVACGSSKAEAPTTPAASIQKPEPPPADVAAYAKEHGLEPAMSLDLGGGVKMEMVLIKAGEFMMGEDNEGGKEEKPAHKVKISKPFYMGKFHVTVAQFRAFAEAMKFQTEAERAGNTSWTWDNGWKEVSGVNWMKPNFAQEDNHPVCVVTWNDAQEFCKWAAKKTGRNICLPTEAQWEYACRAGTTTRYHTGDKDSDLEQAGWFNKNSGMRTHPVGQKKPNAWGLYDMHGNVWHWVQDYFNGKYYADSPSVDPQGPATGGDPVLRGGSWFDGPFDCRAARRDGSGPGGRYTNHGFRCVLDL